MTVTLITGTNSGIGFATALHLARRGHHVYASMRDLGRGDALREAAAAQKLPLETLQLDVDYDDSVENAVKNVLAREGHIDVLINNAGETLFHPIETATIAAAKVVFETNYFGLLRTIHAVLPAMRERRSGTIVNISSAAGLATGAVIGIYSSSKAAVESMSEALALEVYRFGIRVILIEPGVVKAPMLTKALASIPKNEDSPYHTVNRRADMFFRPGLEKGAEPHSIAEVIEGAITASKPKLRYPATIDAELILMNRPRVPDERWVRAHRFESDKDFMREVNAILFPMPRSLFVVLKRQINQRLKQSSVRG